MDINVFALVFMGILKLSLSFQLVSADSNYDSEPGSETVPFEKAKIISHRSRYCITHRGETYCVRMNRSPGDPNEVAEMYKIWMKNMNDNTSPTDAKKLLKNMMRTLKEKKLNQKIKKLSQTVKKAKVSHQGYENQRTQKNKKANLMQRGRQRKLKQKVRQVRQRFVKPVAWQVAGYNSYVPAIPRYVRR